MKYVYFWKPSEAFGQFSQWYSSKFRDINGVEYRCAEQYMMYQKALLFKDTEIADKILKTNIPAEIKALGRQIKNFDDKIWDKYKFITVVTGNYYKFSQNDELQSILLDTRDKVLAEASPYDTIWGIGIAAVYNESIFVNPLPNEQDHWKGQNLLGEALMTVRNMLKYIRESQKPKQEFDSSINKELGILGN